MPIRQNLPLGYQGSVSKPKTQFQDPDDFKNLGPDAWKGEMEGIASWYGADFHGHLTANGEIYNMYDMTAAHKTLPLGTVVKVTSQDTGKSVEVRVNDRGPYVKGRIIDLSKSAGESIGISKGGTTRVKLEVLRWPKDSK
jgi:rare lipoprotein A